MRLLLTIEKAVISYLPRKECDRNAENSSTTTQRQSFNFVSSVKCDHDFIHIFSIS